ncbi:MAG TPA: c-type cytochrome [Candidatus Dormibacteraeota bacterium]|nr:c-type cytochrome [Candidatus Dormibacteraeota bacterium]
MLLCVSLLAACAKERTASAPEVGTAPPATRYEAHLAAGGVAPPSGTLRNPHQGDAAIAKSGALLFTTMNCDGCHGGDAAGWVGPNLADGRWRYGGADQEVFNSIYYGRPKGMPAFGGALGAEGVWTLVTYLRSLKVPADVSTESWETQ